MLHGAAAYGAISPLLPIPPLNSHHSTSGYHLTRLTLNLLHKLQRGVDNTLGPAQVGRVPGGAAVDGEHPRLLALQRGHALLVLPGQGQVALEDEVRAREGRVGVVGQPGGQDRGRGQPRGVLPGDGRVHVVEEELFRLHHRAEPRGAVFLSGRGQPREQSTGDFAGGSENKTNKMSPANYSRGTP